MEQENEKDRVRVMSHEERNDYEGVTIDEQSGKPEDKPQDDDARIFTDFAGRRQDHPFNVQHTTLKDLLWGNLNWKTKLAVIAGGAALVAFLVFVALPVAAFFVGAAALAWLLRQFLIR